jgi:hypothetical protein
VKNYYIIILISFLFYFNFKVSISFLKQLGLRQTKKAKSSYTTSLMKKQKPKAHKKTQTGAGHKKQMTLTQNISRSKIPSPYKNSNWSRQNRKVQGLAPNRRGQKEKSRSTTKTQMGDEGFAVNVARW